MTAILNWPSVLRGFQIESNRIEGIDRVTEEELIALAALLAGDELGIGDLAAYVAVIQPNARLRATTDVPGVRVGDHIAPPSGPRLMRDLNLLLDRVNGNTEPISPHEAHCQYETLHPFTDGNGRSGRALWLWMHKGQAPLGFLHAFYYETLAALPARSGDISRGE